MVRRLLPVHRWLLVLVAVLLGTLSAVAAPSAARAADATLVLGTATTVSVPAGGTATLSFTAGGSGQVELFFDAAVFGDPAFSGSAEVDVLDADGTLARVGFVDRFGPQTLTVTGVPGAAWTAVVTDPGAGGLEVGLLPADSRTTTTAGTLPFEGTLTAALGEDLALTVPTAPGTLLRFTVDSTGLVDVPVPGPVLVIAADDGADVPLATVQVDAPGTRSVELLAPASGVVRLLLLLPGRITGALHVTAGLAPAPGSLDALGVPVTATFASPGDSARFTVEATDGEPFALLVRDVALTGSDTEPEVSVLVTGPDGGFGGSATAVQGRGDVLLQNPTTLTAGTWTVTVVPTGDAVGTVTLVRLHPTTTTSALVLGRTDVLAFPGPGDVRRLTFTAAPGQRLTLRIPDRTLDAQLLLLDPTGSVVGDNGAGISGDYYEFGALRTGGTYTLVVDPLNAGTGTLSLRADLVTDPVRTLALGRRTTVSWLTGQNPRLQFAVRAGDRVWLRLGATTPADASVQRTLLDPNGDRVPLVGDGTPGWEESFAPVTAAGTYTLVLDPAGAVAGSQTLTVGTTTDVVLTGRLGRSTDVTVARPAQQVRLPFDAAPARRGGPFVQWRVTSSTFASVTLRLVDPSGSAVDAVVVPVAGGRGTFAVPVSVAGTWRVEVDPPGPATGSATVRISLADKPS